MSTIQCQWLAGAFQHGLQVFRELDVPKAEDERWAGLCHLALGQTFEAEALLAQAAHHGDPGGWIGLIHLHLLSGDTGLAQVVLRELETKTHGFSSLDEILLTRERGNLAHQMGDLLQATDHLKRAWWLSQGLQNGVSLRSGLAHHLAGLYAARGLDCRAAPYLKYALANEQGARRPYLLGLNALNLGYQGQYGEAQVNIRQALSHCTEYPRIEAILHYEQGVIARLQGTLDFAKQAFQTASHRAAEHGEVETQRYAELGLAAIAIEQGKRLDAGLHLNAVQHLGSSEVLASHLALRQEALKPQRDLGRLTAVAEFFREKHFMRESGWAWLHVIEAGLQAGEATAVERAMQQLTAVCYGIGHAQSMLVELRTLPFTRTYLQNHSVDTAASMMEDLRLGSQEGTLAPLRLEVLGRPRLLVGEKEVRLPLSRALEVLTYLLDHPGSTIGQIQLALFPDAPPKRSKSYIHQVRDALTAGVPGLSIPYERKRKSYTVQLDTTSLSSDVHRFKEALKAVEQGLRDDLDVLVKEFERPFMEGLDSEWVMTEREDLRNWSIRLGLELMGTWYDTGEYVKCLSLVNRLIEIDPLDEALNDLLLKATVKVKGDLAARHIHREVCQRYEKEVGYVPQSLEAMFSRSELN